MKINFKVYKAKKGSATLEAIKKLKDKDDDFDLVNEFIVVGKEVINGNEYYKVHLLDEYGLKIICDLPLDEMAMILPGNELEWDGMYYTEIDIPKTNLTLDLIEAIQKINGGEE